MSIMLTKKDDTIIDAIKLIKTNQSIKGNFIFDLNSAKKYVMNDNDQIK